MEAILITIALGLTCSVMGYLRFFDLAFIQTRFYYALGGTMHVAMAIYAIQMMLVWTKDQP